MNSALVRNDAEPRRSCGWSLPRSMMGLFSVTLLTACGDCVSVGVPGLLVSVVDAATQAAPISQPSLLVTDGSWSEEYPRPQFQNVPPQFSAAAERPGTYKLLVRADGYQDLVVNDVKVSMSDSKCVNVRTVNVKMALKKSS